MPLVYFLNRLYYFSSTTCNYSYNIFYVYLFVYSYIYIYSYIYSTNDLFKLYIASLLYAFMQSST